MKRLFLTIIITLSLFVVSAQNQNKSTCDDKAALELSQFESNWLMSSLNRDVLWLDRIFSEKLIGPALACEVMKNRTKEIAKMIDPALSPSEMKVRISGNIIVLINSPSANDSRGNSDFRNRSYHFLDTFNKRNGKWEIVATHFSRHSEQNNQSEEQMIMKLEQTRSIATEKKISHCSGN